MDNLEKTKELTSIIHNIVVTVAIIIAGIWTLFIFIYTPRASIDISHNISAVPLADGRTFLRIEVKLTNVGDKTEVYDLDSTNIYVEINNLSPEIELIDTIKGPSINFGYYAKENSAFKTLGYAWIYFDQEVNIKPNLSKIYYFTFLIPKQKGPISIYSEIRAKKDTNWIQLKKPTYTTHILNDNFN